MQPVASLVLQSRRDLRWYLGLVALFSLLVQFLIYRKGGMTSEAGGLILLLMWTPGLVAFGLRVAFRQGFADVSFGLGASGVRLAPYLVAWLTPVLVGAVAYGVAWGSGLVAFDAVRLLANKHAIAGHPVLTLTKGVLMCLTVNLPVAALFVAGEELGWRGYMLTRLVDARVPYPVLVSGVIWLVAYAADPWRTVCGRALDRALKRRVSAVHRWRRRRGRMGAFAQRKRVARRGVSRVLECGDPRRVRPGCGRRRAARSCSLLVGREWPLGGRLQRPCGVARVAS